VSTSINREVITAESAQANLLAFLERQTKRAVEADLDLFASGLVSSLFAMELVVHIESSFGVAIGGPDLKLDNFRTVNAMTVLILRLHGNSDA
jgi:methoxymalonate biosynthesis acyl carrier protein